MSETEEKVCCVKKAWKYVVTGVVCAVVGGLVMAGAGASKIQDTITKAQAKNAIVAAAQYSAEQVIAKVTVLGTENSKLEAIKAAVAMTENESSKFIEDATKVEKEAVAEVKKEVKEEAKEDIKKDENVKAEVNVAKAEVKTEVKTAEVKKEVKEATAPKTEVKTEVKATEVKK